MPMAEQDLNRSQISSRLQQMSRKAVTQHVWADSFVQLGPKCGLLADFLNDAATERRLFGLAGEQPGERLILLPIETKLLQQCW